MTECRRRYCVEAEEVSFPCHFAPHLLPAPWRSLLPDRKSAEEEAGQNPNACFRKSLNKSSINAQSNRKTTHDKRREVQWRALGLTTMEIAWSHHQQQQRALGRIGPGSLLNGAVSILTSPIAGERERRGVGGTGMPHAQVSLRTFARPTAIVQTHHSPGRCQISRPSSDLPRPKPLQIWN